MDFFSIRVKPIHASIARRRHRNAFIERGLVSRDEAKERNDYISAEELVSRLEKRLHALKVRGNPQH
jgi:hypothetical protein